jgi:hypothetical protein
MIIVLLDRLQLYMELSLIGLWWSIREHIPITSTDVAAALPNTLSLIDF